jgi:hypothetical protein
MALRKKKGQFYGDGPPDTQEYLEDYSASNAYVATKFADAKCACSKKARKARAFRLVLDDETGAAVRTCTSCKTKHAIGDSAEYLDEAELEECECPCGKDEFEITVGVALYTDSTDVRWVYIGCRCPSCGLVGCYGDWKSESGPASKYLARI